jgi:hypothetical protein
MDGNWLEGVSEHTDPSRKSRDASDQTKTTTAQVANESSQAGPEQASSAQFQDKEIDCQGFKDSCDAGPVQASEDSIVQDSASTLQKNQAKEVPTHEEINGLEEALARIQVLEKENQRIKILEKENQTIKTENHSLKGRLESYEIVAHGTWTKIRNASPKSSTVRDISKAAKRAFKRKCQNTCQASGAVDASNICAHIWPKHCEEGLKAMFGDKYSIHGPENLALFAKPIEQAFDSGQLCFFLRVLISGDRCIRIKILDSSILEKKIGDSDMTFKELEDRDLDMTDHVVSGALLSHHSKEAVHYANTQKWINSAEKESYLALAEFCSPDCVKAQQVSAWLRAHTPDGAHRVLSRVL